MPPLWRVEFECAIGQFGRLGATERLVAERERQQHLTQQFGALEVRGRTGGWEAAHGREQARRVRPAAEQAPGLLVGDRRDDRSGGGVDEADLAAQAGALEREAVTREPEIAELRRELGERGRLALVLEPRLVQRDLGAGVR